MHSWWNFMFCRIGHVALCAATTTVLFNYSSDIYIYIYTQQYMVVTISLGGLVENQMQYNLESAQYLW